MIYCIFSIFLLLIYFFKYGLVNYFLSNNQNWQSRSSKNGGRSVLAEKATWKTPDGLELWMIAAGYQKI